MRVIDRIYSDGQQQVLEVAALLVLGQPVAVIRERIPAWPVRDQRSSSPFRRITPAAIRSSPPDPRADRPTAAGFPMQKDRDTLHERRG
jgi:hypothetical protein